MATTATTSQRRNRAKAHPAPTAPVARRRRRAKTAEAAGVGRIVSLGALVLLGTVIVLGAASLTALLAGYDPPGHEEQARRLRRYAREHRPNLSADTFRPIGEQIDRGEKWARSALKRAVG